MSELYLVGKIIANRYKIVDILGRGGTAITYKALDTKSEREVAIKSISLKGINNWKQIELFEREAKILQQLDFPGIPKYLDYFQIDTKSDPNFYLVRELVSGQSLYELIINGWYPDEKEVKQIAISILKVLIYLQQRLPPIIHRDIKPQNIIRKENGEVFLIDFGAVANVYNRSFNSTIVGTFGYMSPEQFRGKATLSTDIYSLGCTLLFLLTKKCPADLPEYKLKINFISYVNIEQSFIDWLEKSITPDFNIRFQNAFDALAALKKRFNFEPAKTIDKPIGSLIKLGTIRNRLVISIPGLINLKNKNIYLQLLANFPYFFYGILFFIIVLIFSIADLDVLFYSLFKSFWSGLLLWLFLLFSLVTFLIFKYWFLGKKIIVPNPKSYFYRNRAIEQHLIVNYPIKVRVKKYRLPLINKYLTYCNLVCNLKPKSFGFWLTRHENEWLAQEINYFLAKDD